MNTFTINFTDLIGNIWTLDWDPSVSKNNNLTNYDIQDIVHFIKTGIWPKNATSAAKTSYEALAVQISYIIVSNSIFDYEKATALYMTIAHFYDTNKFSKEGKKLFNRCRTLVGTGASKDILSDVFKLMRKIIKSENLFAIKFSTNEKWAIRLDYIENCLVLNPMEVF